MLNVLQQFAPITSVDLKDIVVSEGEKWQIASGQMGDASKKSQKTTVWFCWRQNKTNRLQETDVICRESKKKIMQFLI